MVSYRIGALYAQQGLMDVQVLSATMFSLAVPILFEYKALDIQVESKLVHCTAGERVTFLLKNTEEQ